MLRASGYAARPSEDDDGCTAWRRVIEAISEFWRAKPAEGERVN